LLLKTGNFYARKMISRKLTT